MTTKRQREVRRDLRVSLSLAVLTFTVLESMQFWRVAVVALAVAVLAYWAGTRHIITLRKGELLKAPRAKPLPKQQPEAARARRNGWIPPMQSRMYSEQCAREEHVWCHDGRCECPCGHKTRIRKQAQLDKPPF